MVAGYFVKMAKLVALVCFFTFCGCISLDGQAQAFTATLSGSVRDTSGSVVPGAKVTLSNSESSLQWLHPRPVRRELDSASHVKFSL